MAYDKCEDIKDANQKRRCLKEFGIDKGKDHGDLYAKIARAGRHCHHLDSPTVKRECYDYYLNPENMHNYDPDLIKHSGYIISRAYPEKFKNPKSSYHFDDDLDSGSIHPWGQSKNGTRKVYWDDDIPSYV